MKNEQAIEFIFDEYAHTQMGWIYFKLKIMKSIENSLLQNEYVNNVVKYVIMLHCYCK